MKTILPFLAFIGMLVSSIAFASTVSLGEKLTIEIKGVPVSEQSQIMGAYVVNNAGELWLPMLESGIKASGISSAKLSRKIEEAYKDAKIFTHPRIVILRVKDDIKGIDDREKTNNFVTVTGEVKRDGPVQYRNNLTLYAAIATAGGADTFGAMNRVILERKGVQKTYNLSKGSQNVRIRIGDVIIVPHKNAFGW